MPDDSLGEENLTVQISTSKSSSTKRLNSCGMPDDGVGGENLTAHMSISKLNNSIEIEK